MSNNSENTTDADINDTLKRCNGLHEQMNIMDILSQDIGRMGFSGSPKVPQLVYLSLLTGMLQRPVSLLIKGPSGAGKSFSLRMGKQFIPPKAYEEFEGMTEKAIVYLKDMSLKHRHLIIGEAAGMADGPGRTLLRQLLSEGKVRYATVESTENGLKGSELPTLEGPCGLIMTTTATGIHPEDENRMLSVNLRESPEQIEAALMAQAEAISKPEVTLDTGPWFALYDYMQTLPKRVSIPFATKIVSHMPKTHDKVKRDFPQILSLITAHALLHSWTRDKDEEGRIVATLADYRTVYDLTNEAISQGLDRSVPENIRLLVETVAKEKNSYEGLSVTQLAEKIGRDTSSVSRSVKKALDEGYLLDTNPGQGRVSKLRVGDRKLPNGSALPSPDQLAEAEEQKVLVASPW